MFYNCKNLTYLDLSSFNAENVIDMTCMFSGCGNLAEINLLFQNKTKKLNAISYMFQNCAKLKEIDLTNFDVNLVKIVKN